MALGKFEKTELDLVFFQEKFHFDLNIQNLLLRKALQRGVARDIWSLPSHQWHWGTRTLS